MSIKITPSTKIGRGYIGDLGGKITVKGEEFLLERDEKTGVITVKDKEGKPTGNEAELKKNEKKKTDRSPDYVGFIRIGCDEYELIAYDQHSLSISVFEDAEDGAQK